MNHRTGLEIAVIGMAGKFPQAENIHEFWENILKGKDCITRFTREEMLADGADPLLIENKNYVNAAGVLAHSDKFDGKFFGFSDRESEILDPQQRVFIETCWAALEDAGYNPIDTKQKIGVYAGASANQYLIKNLYANVDYVNKIGEYHIGLANHVDQLASRVAYLFNFTGPALSIQTACSTSLVAIHMACQSLLMNECSMVLAGGVSIQAQQKLGYLYQSGLPKSKDGVCRPFDNSATGIVSGNGVGVVVLKRLEDAEREGDRIDAVIKGSAINNDGNIKAGYTSPSVAGQTKVILDALHVAGVNPEDILSVEAHGTGTVLGDPIEMEALTKAYRHFTKQKQYCYLGSVKSNIGHLNAAAGVTGFIKMVLSLKNGIIPQTLHYKQANQHIDFKNSPFHVADKVIKWSELGTSRLGAVSSFGMGGTNAHCILQGYPAHHKTSLVMDDKYLVCLSAKSELVLATYRNNLAQFIIANKEKIDLANLVFTLNSRQATFEYKNMWVVKSLDDLVSQLNFDVEHDKLEKLNFEDSPIFIFPGQGINYKTFLQALYTKLPVFRKNVENCCNILKLYFNVTLGDILDAKKGIETQQDQLGIFITEYALANTLIALGVKPRVLLGHSLGEYAAACIAGVFSLKDALTLVFHRGRLMQTTPEGRMISVCQKYEEIIPNLSTAISCAAINTFDSCVLSGEVTAINELKEELDLKGIRYKELAVNRAYHSPLVKSIVEKYRQIVAQIQMNFPITPIISTVTGKYISANEICSVDYWLLHLTKTVRFAEAMTELVNSCDGIVVEVAPGNTLSALAKKVAHKDRHYISSLSYDSNDGYFGFLKRLAALWCKGLPLDLDKLHQKCNNIALSLPTYPFERKRHWVDLIGKLKLVDDPGFVEAAYAAKCNVVLSEQSHIIRIWSDVLGIDEKEISLHSNFFELGGHSLFAVQVVAKLNVALGVSIEAFDLYTYDTVASLTDFVLGAKIKATRKVVLQLRKSNSPHAIVFIHPISGLCSCYNNLIDKMVGDYNIFAIQDPCIFSDGAYFSSLEGMLNSYRDYIQEHVKQKTIILAGWSFGGMIANELSTYLNKNNKAVAGVLMIDSWLLSQNELSSSQLSKEDFLMKYSVSSDLDEKFITKLFSTYQNRLSLMKEYSFTASKSTILLYKASQNKEGDRKNPGLLKNNWGKLYNNMSVVDIAADHFSIMQESNTSLLSALMNKDVISILKTENSQKSNQLSES